MASNGRPRTGREWQQHHQDKRDAAAKHAAQLVDEIRGILGKFRAQNGWQPGYVWDPRQGKYTAQDAVQPPGQVPDRQLRL